MTAADDEAPIAAVPLRARKRTLREVIGALGQPKVALMLVLGFSSGLPFMLIGNTLSYWLADYGIKLAAIGFLSWAGLTYSFKFIWGAVVDRIPLPILRRMGRRRSWMLVSQIVVGAGLVGMACIDPKAHLDWLAAMAVVTGVGAATQDCVIDAWRIEVSADADELGLLTAAYSLGFRIVLIGTEAVILVMAQSMGWPVAYAIFGALMLVGIAATFLVKEPERADAVMEAQSHAGGLDIPRRVYDAVVGPFLTFLRIHGIALAALMLGMITLYHLCDYMRGPMGNPYYAALGLTKPTVAAVRILTGTPGAFVGIAVGGLFTLRFGNHTALIVGAVLQPIAVAAFALLGWHGGDQVLFSAGPTQVSLFEVVMAYDSFAMSFSGVALVAYMSTLTSLGYTATQYALLTSALTWTGKTLKGFSGVIVESLHQGRSLLDAYALFYVLSAAIGVPAIVLCLVLARPRGAAIPALEETSRSIEES